MTEHKSALAHRACTPRNVETFGHTVVQPQCICLHRNYPSTRSSIVLELERPFELDAVAVAFKAIEVKSRPSLSLNNPYPNSTATCGLMYPAAHRQLVSVSSRHFQFANRDYDHSACLCSSVLDPIFDRANGPNFGCFADTSKEDSATETRQSQELSRACRQLVLDLRRVEFMLV